MEKTIVFKNFWLETVIKVLDYSMPFQKSRVRNNFLKVVREKLNAREANRMDLLKEFGEQDENGKAVMESTMVNGQPVPSFKIKEGKKPDFDKEFLDLMNDDAVIDVLDSWSAQLGDIKSIINQSPVVLDTNESMQCEGILEALNAYGKPKPKAPAEVKPTAVPTQKGAKAK